MWRYRPALFCCGKHQCFRVSFGTLTYCCSQLPFVSLFKRCLCHDRIETLQWKHGTPPLTETYLRWMPQPCDIEAIYKFFIRVSKGNYNAINEPHSRPRVIQRKGSFSGKFETTPLEDREKSELGRARY